MKLLIILSLSILTSCASMTKEEEAKYNNQRAIEIMSERAFR